MNATAQTAPAPTPAKKWMKWTGWLLTLAPVFFMLLGMVTAFTQPQAVAQGMARFGYAPDRMTLVLTLEVIAIVLYLIPQTAVFGAIFMTAYFGGAVATHLRIHDPGWPLAVICGTCAWLGLYLREPRLRPLVPLRRRS